MELRQQLSKSQRDLEQSLTKFQRFAERADVGIFILGIDGVYSYRNDAWYDICSPGERNDLSLAQAWVEIVDPEYMPIGQARFALLAETKQHQ